MTYGDFWRMLAPHYGDREAKAMARLVFESRYALSLADLCLGKDTELSAKESATLREIGVRLLRNEPVQYVLGQETFCGRTFVVRPGVLIPRPETALMPAMMADIARNKGPHPAILDIGTGSGCIAITAALDIDGADVTAWDNADTALNVARENAERLAATVAFEHRDIFLAPHDDGKWDIIASNPPYIRASEALAMSDNVLAYEPHEALFVPDDDPLCYVRAIAHYSIAALKRGGTLLIEINTALADDTADALRCAGLRHVKIKNDGYGLPRFAIAEA